MSLTYGFFNSLNHDRKYSAEDMAGFLDGIVDDGVYAAIGDRFYVSPYSGMDIQVGKGRAWFDHTWTSNTTNIILTVSDSDPIYPRIDAVVLEVNKADRRNYIKIVDGEPAALPQRPEMEREGLVKQWVLAYITVPAEATEIGQEHIENMVDTSETPLCSAINLAGIPSGGETGMVLAKESGESGAVGWHNVNNLPRDKWWQPTGISDSQVIAAFLFGDISDEHRALKNLNAGSSFQLIKSGGVTPVWDMKKGYRVGPDSFLACDTLEGISSQIVTTIACFSDLNNSENKAFVISAPHNHDRIVEARFRYYENYTPVNADGGGFTSGTGNAENIYIHLSQVPHAAGVLGVDFVGEKLYYNGDIEATSKRQRGQPIHNTGSAIVGFDNNNSAYTFAYVYAIVFYSAQLSADQHYQVADTLNLMRGG